MPERGPWEDFGGSAVAESDGPWMDFAEPAQEYQSPFSDEARRNATTDLLPPSFGGMPLTLPPELEYNAALQPTLELPRLNAETGPWTAAAMSVLNPFAEPTTTAGAINLGLGLIEGITSPAGAAGVTAAPMVGPYGRAAIGAGFGVPMLTDIPQSYRDWKAAPEGSQEKKDAFFRMAGNVVLPGMIAKGSAADIRARPTSKPKVSNATQERQITEGGIIERAKADEGRLQTEAKRSDSPQPSGPVEAPKEAVKSPAEVAYDNAVKDRAEYDSLTEKGYEIMKRMPKQDDAAIVEWSQEQVANQKKIENIKNRQPGGRYGYPPPTLEQIAKLKEAIPPKEPPPPTPPAAEASPANEGGAPTPNLEAVYRIFQPEPKQKAPIGGRIKEGVEAVRTGVSSKFRPLDRLAEDIAKAYPTRTTVRTTTGTVTTETPTTPNRMSGTFEALKGSTGRSEAEVFRFDQDVSRAVKGKEKDFNAYMFLRRSLDRLTQDLSDIQRAQAGEEVANLNRRSVAGYTIPQLQADLAALESKIGPEAKATFEKAADAYQQHMDKALQWQVESGRMSQEVYDAIKAGNQFYAPFKVLKYLEESNRPEGTGRRIDTPAEYTKAMVGIEDPNFKLGDMLAAGRMGLRVSRILSDKHAAMRSLADLAPYDLEGRFIRRMKEGEEAPKGSSPVNVFEEGKQLRYSVPQEVADAVQLFDTQRSGLVDTIFRGAAVPFRAGATAWNIPFQAANFAADIPRATLVSKTGFRGNPVDIVRLPFDFVHSVYTSIMGDVVAPLTGIKPPKLFFDFLDSGAAGTTMQEAFTPGALRFHQSTRLSEGTRLGKSVLRTLPQIATAIEQSTKILGVKRAMRMTGSQSGAELYKQGKDLLSEVRQFSGSPDFGRMGKWTEAYRLNVLVPFLNARIQGTVADLGRLTGRDGAAMAAETWGKLGLAIGVPTAALYALNNSPDYAADYAKIPEKEKQNYWHIPKDSFVTLDNGEKIRDYWRIPKRESAKWIANLTETSLDFAKQSNPDQAARWMQSLIEDVSPVNIQGRTLPERAESVVAGVNPLIKAPLQAATGRDLYRHRDLIPDAMKKASPEQQFTDRTPEIFKQWAQAMPDVSPEVLRSPIMLENLTRDFTAGLFTQFLPGKPVEGRSGAEQSPLLRRFQAALYTDERAVREEIQALQREAADTYLERHRKAESLIKENKGASPRDILIKAAQSKGADERLLRHTADLIVAERAGLTGSERQLLALPVQQRAQFITRRLQAVTGTERRDMILNMSRKRILTEAVAEEVARLMTQE